MKCRTIGRTAFVNTRMTDSGMTARRRRNPSAIGGNHIIDELWGKTCGGWSKNLLT